MFVIEYLNIVDWGEYKMVGLETLERVRPIFDFIESAVLGCSSCLIVSSKNKCSSVAIAVAYMLLKYRWSVQRTLELINQKKIDIEMTKHVLK